MAFHQSVSQHHDKINRKGFDLFMSSFALRLIALITMLIDHTYVALFPTQLWMNCIGRLSFPIFAFQLAEGYQKTKQKQKYALRLFFFAILSETPFDLMAYGTLFYWHHQNIMWTLLLGFLAVRLTDLVLARWNDTSVRFTAIFFIILVSMVSASLLCLDYGAFGILMIISFFLLNGKPWWIQILCVLLLNLLMGGSSLSVLGIHFPIQLFGTLSMLPILRYNGKQGHHGKAWRWFCYTFYPVHLFLLSLVV